MASVFLSYDHDDAGRAAHLAAALETHGHSVWWDRQIHGGAEYNEAIETAVETSDAVIVLWSGSSVRSAWVRDEAGEGRDRGRLVPVLIEALKPPMGFRQYQTLDLAGLNGGKRIPRLTELLHAIDQVAGAPLQALAPEPPERPVTKLPRAPGGGLSRRTALAGGGAALAAIGGGAMQWSSRDHEDPRFVALMSQGNDALANAAIDGKALKAMDEAVAMRPDSAKAWGLAALLKALAAQGADPGATQDLVQQAHKAAQRALSIDAKQPNALLAMFELEGSTLDWFTRDQRLRQIIAIDPRNLGAIAELVLLTQATGMCRESWQWNERALALQPLSGDYLSKRALKLWILSRSAEADKVINQVRALYPTDPWAWFVRVHLYIFTGRARAALAMLDSERAMSAHSPLTKLWRASLPAFDNPSPAAIARARQACVSSAETAPPLANEAVQIACAIKDAETAFDIANGTLLSRGPIVPRQRPGSTNALQNAAWRISTQWMFTPPVAIMHSDARFLPLCEGIGLTDYWRRRGVKPDYMVA